MEWYVLVLILSLPSSIQADCSSQCLKCSQQILNTDEPIRSLTCTLECEGTLLNADELEKCGKTLQMQDMDLSEFREDEAGARSTPEREDGQEASIANVVKRYGGFIKRIDKNKNKIVTSPWRENSVFKGTLPKKYDFLRKFGERDLSDLSEDAEGENAAFENENGVYNNAAAINEVKRYGGFLRKFGPKRSNSMEEGSREELQKRYGGFMRRIRPKLNNLKWDNQKRYGGFLRRHFKISVRSDEEPSSYDDFGL